ncbi:MAG: sulfatase-like hydrolase/transferase [Planctomycetota bacterium]
MIRLKSPIVLIALLVLSTVFQPVEAQSIQTKMPNVVVLFSDDAGYADFGFQPDCSEDMKQLTPYIDSIAADGARFSNAYMSGPVCSPSRAGLMTGRYQQRFGYDNNLPPGFESGLDLSETFMSTRLRELGYSTGLIGKWHLGYPDQYHPNERGFDWFYGCLQGSRSYFPIEQPSPHRVILENREPTAETSYVTDRFGEAACRFITEHKDEPFFLFVSFTTPHGPLQPKESDAERTAHIEATKRSKYAGLIVSLDDNVGRILSCLDEYGLEENTLVIFTNDNGGQTKTGAMNTPLQGSKGQIWEGGIRVPWAMRLPGTIEAGSVIDDPVIALDILPTIVELSGHEIQAEWELDGISLYPRLSGETDSLPQRPLFWRAGGTHGRRAMRMGEWKIVDNRDGRDGEPVPMLFNLSTDIAEENDLSDEHPEVLGNLIDRLDEWESELVPVPYWGPGSNTSNR